MKLIFKFNNDFVFRSAFFRSSKRGITCLAFILIAIQGLAQITKRTNIHAKLTGMRVYLTDPCLTDAKKQEITFTDTLSVNLHGVF